MIKPGWTSVCAIDMWWQSCDSREIASGAVSAMQ